MNCKIYTISSTLCWIFKTYFQSVQYHGSIPYQIMKYAVSKVNYETCMIILASIKNYFLAFLHCANTNTFLEYIPISRQVK